MSQLKTPQTAASGPSYDPALSVPELLKKITALGIKKANTKVWQLFILGMLAGLYIGFGGHLFLVAMQQGLGRIVGGTVFSLGLVLVVIAGAELFTGNVMMVVSSVLTLYTVKKILKNWITVYLGNLLGAVLLAFFIWQSGLIGSPGDLNDLGLLAVKSAQAKIALSFGAAFLRGVFCNMLVILAIIMSYIAKDVVSKIVCCIFPIMAFVACGFEHCVANMYLIPAGLFAAGTFWSQLPGMFHNIIPVTLGNIVGGILILAAHPNRIRQAIFILKNKKRLLEEGAVQ